MNKKEWQLECIVRSETAFAFTGGMKENLRLQSDLIIDKFFKGLGPNAKGEFRFRITFIPDGLTNRL